MASMAILTIYLVHQRKREDYEVCLMVSSLRHLKSLCHDSCVVDLSPYWVVYLPVDCYCEDYSCYLQYLQ